MTTSSKNISRFGFLLSLLAAFLIAWYFHNKFWWGPDDGYLGYAAQLILDGEVPHKDFKVIHTGLIYFINALFLHIADGDLVGLRYPLIAITVIQTGIAYKMVESRGILISLAAASMAIAFSFIQFSTPTPNWYTPVLVLFSMYAFNYCDARHTTTILLVGFLVGLTFLFRQLTAVILAGAVTTALLVKNSSDRQFEKAHAGKIVIYLITIVLGLYVFKTARITGFFLIAIYPLTVLMLCARYCNIGTKRTIEIISLLTLGAIFAALPMAIYYVMNGAFVEWLHGTLIRPLDFVEMPLFKLPNFFAVPNWSLQLLREGHAIAAYGLFFWISVLTVPMTLGIVTIRRLSTSLNDFPKMAVIASIVTLSAIHFESYIYVYYSIVPVIVALLLTIERTKTRNLYAIFILIVSTIAIHGHAGQLGERGIKKIATNTPHTYEPALIPNTSIIHSIKEQEKYQEILSVIDNCSGGSDTIYIFPMNPELYFLSNKKSPFDFIVSVIGLSNENDLEISRNIVDLEKAPALIIHAHNDVYNSDMSTQLFNHMIPSYEKIGEYSDLWTVYQHKTIDDKHSCRSISEK